MLSPIDSATKVLKQFLLSQYFSDGFRITFGVLLPSFICFQFNIIQIGVAISLGALCTSIPDNPGPPEHKRNAMLVTIGLNFGMALLTGLLGHYPILLAILIAASCFLFSMLQVFGARSASVGISVLIVMILGIQTKASIAEVFLNAVFLLAGSVWYFLLSSISNKLLPYRAAQQILAECIQEVAAFMRIKAKFYNDQTDVTANFKDMLEQQVVVNQYQENVREILFKTRKILRDTTPTGKKLLLIFVELMDLYEDILGRTYQYKELQKQYKNQGILPLYEDIILSLAYQLSLVGDGLQQPIERQTFSNLNSQLFAVKTKIDLLEKEGIGIIPLKKALVNIRSIAVRIQRMVEYDTQPIQLSIHRQQELPRFVQHQVIDWNLFKANLSLQSSHFRHALRVSFVSLLAYIFTQTISEGQHSYWILLTIIVILKPGFSLTKQRNLERIIGTIAGGVVGLVILTLFPTEAARFAFLVLFMLLTYSFIRIKYVVSVLFMTPYILIVFSFTTQFNDSLVAWERIVDTLIGAGAAFTASYFIFPSWESYQLKTVIRDLLKANLMYLQKMTERNPQSPESESAYRLARKTLYVENAHITAAFQRMLAEPKSKQTQADLLYRLVVLNHQLTSYLATLSLQINQADSLNLEEIRYLRSIGNALKEALEKMNNEKLSVELFSHQKVVQNQAKKPKLSMEFLADVLQNTNDIKKITAQFSFVK